MNLAVKKKEEGRGEVGLNERKDLIPFFL